MIGAGNWVLETTSLGWYWDGWAKCSWPFFFPARSCPGWHWDGSFFLFFWDVHHPCVSSLWTLSNRMMNLSNKDDHPVSLITLEACICGFFSLVLECLHNTGQSTNRFFGFVRGSQITLSFRMTVGLARWFIWTLPITFCLGNGLRRRTRANARQRTPSLSDHAGKN